MSWFKTSLTCSLLLICAAIFAFAHPQMAHADPNLANPDRAESIITEINLGGSHFRLTTDRSAIPTDGGYSFTVEITPSADLISVNLHFQLMREEDGWPFHYFGDSVYIERDTGGNDDDNDGGDGSDERPRTATTATRRIYQPEVIEHVLQRRTGDHLDGLGMREGVYYVAVIVTVTTEEGSESATLRDLLVVYDPAQPTLNMMPVVQLSALPARNVNGIFLNNPGTGVFEERRATLEALSDWVSSNPNVRLTLAISPLFLEELYKVSQGFSYIRPLNNGAHDNSSNGNNDNSGYSGENGSDEATEGDTEDIATPTYYVRELPAESNIATNSARTIDALRSAYDTGRLTITAQGYADPDYAVLSALGLADDLPEHYELGREVIQTVLGIEPSNITVPWSNNRLSANNISTIVDMLPLSVGPSDPAVPSAAHAAPSLQHPRVVGSSAGAAFGSSTALTEDGSMLRFQPLVRTETADIVMACDDLSTALSTEVSRARFISELLEARQNTELVPILVRAHNDMEPVTMLIDNLDRISRYNWLDLVDGEFTPHDEIEPIVLLDPQTIADMTRSAPSLAPPPEPFRQVAPLPGSIQSLQAGRKAFLGLQDALQEEFFEVDEAAADEFDQYSRKSLAAFAGPGTEVRLLADGISVSTSGIDGIVLSQQVNDYVDYWFDGITLEVQSMNFSGSGGLLPITVENNSGHTFYLTVRYISPGQSIIVYPEYTNQAFPQGETFLEPTVELRNIVSGPVDVQLWAGDYLITEESVRVSATYVDRIVIIVLVVLAGAGLAFFIWKRTRDKAETIQDPHKES